MLKTAIQSGNYRDILSSDGISHDYLVLVRKKSSNGGTFCWTRNKTLGKQSAKQYFPNVEGINHHNGVCFRRETSSDVVLCQPPLRKKRRSMVPRRRCFLWAVVVPGLDWRRVRCRCNLCCCRRSIPPPPPPLSPCCCCCDYWSLEFVAPSVTVTVVAAAS